MDYIRSALSNAHASGLTLGDVLLMSIHAQDAKQFDEAVNILGLAHPYEGEDNEFTNPL